MADPESAESSQGKSPDPVDIHGVADATLGGYYDEHDRPPAFEGADGHPYTVSIEREKVGDLIEPFAGFLVFPRWARNGLGIIGHVETPVLWRGTEDAVLAAARALPLERVKQLLDEAVAERPEDLEEWPD